ncbi:MAG: aconitase X swivel domain-containing protein [Hyphomicrobiales bacterium]
MSFPKTISGEILCSGSAFGKLLVLTEPLSFWGGFDPRTGKIIDKHHPQVGCSVEGRILVIPESRGSAGTPAGLAEAVRIGKGPLGVVTKKPDINILAGFMTAAKLYGVHVPMIVVSGVDYEKICLAGEISILPSGELSLG